MSDDGLSTVHYKAVWAEIQGRFFSPEEADRLKEEIDRYTIVSPEIRAAAAQVWEAK
jgi:hypothetical protein